MGQKEYSIFEKNVPGCTEALQSSTAGVAGCGGLGANAALALARAGAGRLILADHDRVEPSNLNRQPYFLGDLGKPKVEVLGEYLRSVNPKITLDLHRRKLKPEDIPKVFAEADLLIEAFDRAENKKWLIESWTRAFPEKPIICGSGLGGIGRTSSLKVRSGGNIYFCGDGKSDSSMGLCSARVCLVACMQANVAIELLIRKTGKNDDNG